MNFDFFQKTSFFDLFNSSFGLSIMLKGIFLIILSFIISILFGKLFNNTIKNLIQIFDNSIFSKGNTLNSAMFMVFCAFVGSCSGILLAHGNLNFLRFFILFIIIAGHTFVFPFILTFFQMMVCVLSSGNFVGCLFSTMDFIEIVLLYILLRKYKLNDLNIHIKLGVAMIGSILLTFAYMIQLASSNTFVLSYYMDGNVPLFSTKYQPTTVEYIYMLINTKFHHFQVKNFTDIFCASEMIIKINLIKSVYYPLIFISTMRFRGGFNSLKVPSLFYYIGLILTCIGFSFFVYNQYFFFSILFMHLLLLFASAFIIYGFCLLDFSMKYPLFYSVFILCWFDEFILFLCVLFSVGILNPVLQIVDD